MKEPQVFETSPIQVEAMMFTSDNANDVYEWVAANTKGAFSPESVAASGSGVSIDPADGRMVIASMRGQFKVDPGDFVINVPGAPGQFTKMPYEIFVDAHHTTAEGTMPEKPAKPTDDSESQHHQETPDAPAVDTTPGG